jgi:hypothetical protein
MPEKNVVCSSPDGSGGSGRAAAGLARSAILALGFAFAIASVEGCAAPPTRPSEKVAGADTDAVVVDFYLDGRPSVACSGTLVSPRLVLTAAHCADASDGARVTVGAADQTAEVARVIPYDWTDDVAHHALEHDLALVVLREALVAPAYARVSTDDPAGSSVTVSGQAGVLGPEAPAGRPYSVPVSLGRATLTTDAGGAARRSDGAVLGVFMGAGAVTGLGYVARVDEKEIAEWLDFITAVVAAESGHATEMRLQTDVELIDGPEPLVPAAAPRPTSQQAPRSYDAATGIEVMDPRQNITRRGSNYWISSLAGHDAFDYAGLFAATHPEANFVFAHGYPGLMEGLPSRAQASSLITRNVPLILGSCFGGASSGGKSNAARIADGWGLQRGRVYGCSGLIFTYPDVIRCDGHWVDGNGVPIVTGGTPLLNCTYARQGKDYVVQSCN